MSQRLVVVVMKLSLLFLVFAFSSFSYVAAQHPSAPSDICSAGSMAESSFCHEKTNAQNINPFLGQDSILQTIIRIVTTVAGLISVVMIMIGGFRYVVSGGDQNAVKSAKDTILYAIIGLVVAVFAQVIVTFIISRL